MQPCLVGEVEASKNTCLIKGDGFLLSDDGTCCLPSGLHLHLQIYMHIKHPHANIFA